MLEGITIRQFREWRAYAELEPFGPRREDARSAQIAWILAELQRDKKKKRKAWRLEEFLLGSADDELADSKAKKRGPAKPWQAMRAAAASFAASCGAKLPGGGDGQGDA